MATQPMNSGGHSEKPDVDINIGPDVYSSPKLTIFGRENFFGMAVTPNEIVFGNVGFGDALLWVIVNALEKGGICVQNGCSEVYKLPVYPLLFSGISVREHAVYTHLDGDTVLCADVYEHNLCVHVDRMVDAINAMETIYAL